MREIVLDTETTGRDVAEGHRIVEIGCLELMNHIPTGRTYHRYLDPECEVDEGAAQIHGLRRSFLRQFPPFRRIAAEFLTFIGSDPVIAHNAPFDIGFLNAELTAAGEATIPDSQVRDTLAMARRRFPGAPASLDALCKRFGVDNTGRTYHGALLDSELLADVYLQLLGGRQPDLTLAAGPASTADTAPAAAETGGGYRAPRPHAPTAAEAAAHAALVAKLKDPLWDTGSDAAGTV